jgi:NADH-quinone oxidoreductase subunit M
MKTNKNVLLTLILLDVLLVQIFLVLDILWFYLLFEVIIFPFYIIIVINKNDYTFISKKLVNRRQSSFLLLFFYTIISSFALVISLLTIYINSGTTCIPLLACAEWEWDTEKYLWVLLFLSLSVKIPIIPFHIWLPEAHVEAPTEISVILASIILKIGVYGVIRILMPIFPSATVWYSSLFWSWNIISSVYSSLCALVQVDIKRVIAYASIGHMNICMLGLFTLNYSALCGSYVMAIGHGFVSGGLFFSIGIFYIKIHTKNIKYYSGMFSLMPVLSSLFIFFVLSNMSIPGTVNFVGELLIFKYFLESNLWSVYVCIFATLLCTSLYNLRLLNVMLFGRVHAELLAKKLSDADKIELYTLLPLVFFTILFGLEPRLILDEIFYEWII